MLDFDFTEFKAAMDGFLNDIRSFRDEKVRLEEQKKAVEILIDGLKERFRSLNVSSSNGSIEERIKELEEELKAKRGKIEELLTQPSS